MTEDSIGTVLDRHWSALTVTDRAILLSNLGVDGKNEEYLDGKSMSTILVSGQDDLPPEIRGRLIMSVTEDGFSPDEYKKVKELLRRKETTSELFTRGEHYN